MTKKLLIEQTNTILNYEKIENIRLIQVQDMHAVVAATYSPIGYIKKENGGYDTQIMNYILYAGSEEQCKHILEYIFTSNKELMRIPSDAILQVKGEIMTV